MRKTAIALPAVLLTILAIVMAGCQAGGTSTPTPAATKTGTPAKLAFITQPGGAAAGATLSAAPEVAVVDANGNRVTNTNVAVKLTITAGTGSDGATLFGPSLINTVNGSVQFKDLSINQAGTDYTLTASTGSLLPAASASFSISSASPAKLAFTIQPGGGTAGSPFTTQPEIIVLDRYGNTVTGYSGSVTMYASYTMSEYANPYDTKPTTQTFPISISGATTVPIVNSKARFTDISGQLARPNYSLRAVSGSLESATSAFFTVVPGKATQLEFTVQASGATAGQPFEKQPKAAIEDAYGNVVLSARDNITVSITPGSGTDGALLSGATTQLSDAALGGLAEFSDLSIDLAGSGYTLTAAVDGLPPATSQVFDVKEAQ